MIYVRFINCVHTTMCLLDKKSIFVYTGKNSCKYMLELLKDISSQVKCIQVSVLLSNCKQSITSLSLLVGTTVASNTF